MIVEKFEQNTPEWNAARVGIPTSSCFDKIVTTKGAPSKQSQKYMYQLAAERVTGVKEETYQNAAMQRGIEMEAEARGMYEFVTGNEVECVGICYPDKKKLYGCSPDGLVGKDGILEIKCPTSAVHVDYLLTGSLPTVYFQQVMGQLLVTGRKWVDFFSYFPGLPPMLIKVEPDGVFRMLLSAELDNFCKELNNVTEQLRRL